MLHSSSKLTQLIVTEPAVNDTNGWFVMTPVILSLLSVNSKHELIYTFRLPMIGMLAWNQQMM